MVEEFLVEWDPEDCTLQEALTQQAQGFVINSIHSLDEGVSTPRLQAATAAKRPRGPPREADRLPPETRCRVQFAPSPQGPNHIRTIRGGKEALDAFLLTENKHTPEPTPGRDRPPVPAPGIQRNKTPTPTRKQKRTPPHTPSADAPAALITGTSATPLAHGPSPNSHRGGRPGQRLPPQQGTIRFPRSPNVPMEHHGN